MELSKIKGISQTREKLFNKLGIFNTKGLLRLFPRGYLDMRSKQLLKYAYHNDIVLTTGKVVSLPISRYFRKGGIVKVTCEQEGFIFNVTWFNQPYVQQKLIVGEEYLFYGRVRNELGVTSLVNPSFELLEKSFRLKGIVPQYPTKNYLPQKLVRDACKLAVDIEKPTSAIPEHLQQKYELTNLYQAYKNVHNPSDFTSLKKYADRIAIEEYFALISAFKYIKGSREQVRINKYSCTAKDLLKFIVYNFNFEFTAGQKTAVNEIFADMTSSAVMNRLMQGDVGSGKTAVSLCAMFIAVSSGYQAVMLTPTEVLAEQNYNVISNAFKDYNVTLMTGSKTAKEKKQIKQDLKDGNINIIVGTHALLEDDVEFKNLSLCVCDEQQRFGVAQRSALMNKGITPDVLVMSATPIPRTLSLICYGDLDITTIKDKPASRQEISTSIVPNHKYNDMLKFIEKEAEKGHQAYFVCPKIDGDEEGEIISVTELYNDLKEKMSIRIGLLHGKMKEKEKTSIMLDFKEKKIDLLVSTTVIEVGVDVKDATVMVIYNAERFGLSQLHQLRGRVGRSDKKSYCFLLSNSKSDIALERLSIIKENNDGFKISECDYKLRGAGDFMGNRQSGKFMNDLGSLNYSTEAIFIAKKISDEAFEKGFDKEKIKELAIEKLHKLKDITMN